jgi:hypothetical protein
MGESAPFENRLLAEADRLVGDARGYLVIDDAVLPKKGRNSVGVAPQYASSQGKTANCQSLVSVMLASREVPVMVGLRLFLPESWTDDLVLIKCARVLAERQVMMSKPNIAMADIDRVMAAGAHFGCVHQPSSATNARLIGACPLADFWSVEVAWHQTGSAYATIARRRYSSAVRAFCRVQRYVLHRLREQRGRAPQLACQAMPIPPR